MKRVIQPSAVSRTGTVKAAVLASCLWLAGCAGPFGFSGAGGATAPFRDPGLSMQAASEAVVIGQSSQQDVMAALGPGTVVRFDSGYEVWVYRRNPLRSEPANAEFVILFAPSGIVKKTRIRPAYGVSRSIRD
jgi:hypothetical protein